MASDFSRFNFYAGRIVNLNYLPYGWHKKVKIPFDLQLLQIIQEYMDQHGGDKKRLRLLPNLRRLEFSSPFHASFAPEYLLGKHTVALSLDFVDHYDELEVKTLFPLIKTLSPKMENLEFGIGGAISCSECPDLSELVCSLQGLRRLATGPRSLNTSAIRHLASISYLHSLNFPDSATQILRAIASLPTHPFKSLRHLEMSGASLSGWPALLARLRPHQLDTVILNFDALPSALETQGFFVALSDTSAQPGLRTLRLNHAWKSQSPRVSTQTIIDFGILEPLLAFDNLTSLYIGLVCVVAVDDSQITQMAKSWPKLQNLQLGCHLGWERHSAVTHRGLLAIVAGCPDLETLGISFDATDLKSNSLITVPEGFINLKIKYLHVGDSRIVESAGTARFISHLFPKVEGIGGAWLYVSAGAFTTRQRKQHQMWQEVATTLQKSRKVTASFTESGLPGSVDS